MNDIISMVAMGIIAGMISGFFTRIIKKGMIFSFVGDILKKRDNTHVIMTTKHSGWVSFLQCIFCLQPWIAIILCVAYIIDYNPWWVYATIGVLGAWGAGNIVCEIIYCLRGGE